MFYGRKIMRKVTCAGGALPVGACGMGLGARGVHALLAQRPGLLIPEASTLAACREGWGRAGLG